MFNFTFDTQEQLNLTVLLLHVLQNYWICGKYLLFKKMPPKSCSYRFRKTWIANHLIFSIFFHFFWSFSVCGVILCKVKAKTTKILKCIKTLFTVKTFTGVKRLLWFIWKNYIYIYICNIYVYICIYIYMYVYIYIDWDNFHNIELINWILFYFFNQLSWWLYLI